MTCDACGAQLPKGSSPRKRFCGEACRSRFRRGARSSPPAEPDGIGSTETATMLALQQTGKLGTPGGQAALVLARRIDRSERDTGAGLASMVNRLQETIAAVTADVIPDDDPIDELARRREEKQRAAGRES